MLVKISEEEFVSFGIKERIGELFRERPNYLNHYASSIIQVNEVAILAGIELEYFISTSEVGEIAKGEGVEEVINGFFTVLRNHAAEQVENISIISFDQHATTMALDFIGLFRALEEDKSIRRVEFSTTVGCPTRSFIKFACKKYEMNLIGIKKQAARLLDGQLVDVELYEYLKG